MSGQHATSENELISRTVTLSGTQPMETSMLNGHRPNGTPQPSQMASDTTPLLEKRNSSSVNLGSPPSTLNDKWNKFRTIKCGILFALALTFMIMFTINHEHEENWHHIAIANSHPKGMTIRHDSSKCILVIEMVGSLVAESSTEITENNVTVMISDGQENKSNWTVGLKNDTDNEVKVSKTIDYSSSCDENRPFIVTFLSTTEYYIGLAFQNSVLSNQHSNEVIYAAIVLLGVYVLIVFELVHRTLAAMLGSMAALAVLSMLDKRPTLDKVISWIDEETLSLLFGMMVLVAIFTETGFFDYCALMGYKLSNGKIWPLITILCLFSAIVSAFLDNVTTILLLTPITIRLCEVVRLEPKYILIAEVLFSNIGGTATAVGDPPNVIIVSNSVISSMGIDFAKFSLHMFLGIIFVTVGAYGMLRLQFRKLDSLMVKEAPAIIELKREIEIWRKASVRILPACREESTVLALLQQKVATLENILNKKLYRSKKNDEIDFKSTVIELESKYKIRDKVLLIKSSCVLAVVIVFFFLHSFIEEQLSLTLGWIAVLGAISLLVLSDIHDLESLFDKVEWATLLFFAALFVMMEALTELGLIDFIGDQTSNLIQQVPSSSRLAVALIIILWVSAIASSFIDNIPFTTAMVPVILKLSEDQNFDLPLEPMVWALAFGACLGGNGTLIGASANVVCAGIAEQHGYGFSFKEFFKIGFPMMLVTTLVANVYLMICHVAFEWHEK